MVVVSRTWTPARRHPRRLVACPRMDEGQQGTDAPEAQIGSLRRRAVAWLVDYGIAGGVFYTVEEIGAGAIAPGIETTTWTAAPTLATPDGIFVLSASMQALGAIAFLLLAGLTSRRPGRWRGQTPGKRLAGLRVVQADGSPITSDQAWRRTILMLITLGFWAYPLGLLVDLLLGTPPLATGVCVIVACTLATVSYWGALRSTDRRLLHDRSAGTAVIRTAKRTTTVVISADGGARPQDGPPPADPDAPLTILPLPRRTGTLVFGAIAVLFNLGFATAAGAWIAVQPSRGEFRDTFDAPGAAAARDAVVRGERAYKACVGDFLTLPDECDSLRELDLASLGPRRGGPRKPGEITLKSTRERSFGDVYTEVVVIRSESRAGQIWESRVDDTSNARRTCRLPSGKTCPGVPPLGW